MRKFKDTHFLNFNFDTLIVGKSNIEAITRARNLLSLSLKEWGIIFIHSANSFGKTHLIGAVINEFLIRSPQSGIYVLDIISKNEDWQIPQACNLVIVDGIGPILSDEAGWHKRHLVELVKLIDQCAALDIAVILAADSFYLNKLPLSIKRYLRQSNILQIGFSDKQHLKEIGRLFASTLTDNWFQICEQDVETIVASEELPRVVQSRLSLLRYEHYKIQ